MMHGTRWWVNVTMTEYALSGSVPLFLSKPSIISVVEDGKERYKYFNVGNVYWDGELRVTTVPLPGGHKRMRVEIPWWISAPTIRVGSVRDEIVRILKSPHFDSLYFQEFLDNSGDMLKAIFSSPAEFLDICDVGRLLKMAWCSEGKRLYAFIVAGLKSQNQFTWKAKRISDDYYPLCPVLTLYYIMQCHGDPHDDIVREIHRVSGFSVNKMAHALLVMSLALVIDVWSYDVDIIVEECVHTLCERFARRFYLKMEKFTSTGQILIDVLLIDDVLLSIPELRTLQWEIVKVLGKLHTFDEELLSVLCATPAATSETECWDFAKRYAVMARFIMYHCVDILPFRTEFRRCVAGYDVARTFLPMQLIE